MADAEEGGAMKLSEKYAVKRWAIEERKPRTAADDELRENEQIIVELHDGLCKLEVVVEAISPLDISGAESWANAIVEEWRRGKRDWSAVKVAEKLLIILPNLRQALAELDDA